MNKISLENLRRPKRRCRLRHFILCFLVICNVLVYKKKSLLIKTVPFTGRSTFYSVGTFLLSCRRPTSGSRASKFNGTSSGLREFASKHLASKNPFSLGVSYWLENFLLESPIGWRIFSWSLLLVGEFSLGVSYRLEKFILAI